MVKLETFAWVAETLIFIQDLPPNLHDRMQQNHCTDNLNSCAEIQWIYGVVCVTIGFILVTLGVAATLTWLFKNRYCCSARYSVKNQAVPASDLVDMTHSIQDDKGALHKDKVDPSPYLSHGPAASAGAAVIVNPSARLDNDDDGIYEELGEPKLRDHNPTNNAIDDCFVREQFEMQARSRDNSIAACFLNSTNAHGKACVQPQARDCLTSSSEGIYIDGVSASDLENAAWDSGCDTLNLDGAPLPTPPSDFFTLD